MPKFVYAAGVQSDLRAHAARQQDGEREELDPV
jgi:hypothetical protein